MDGVETLTRRRALECGYWFKRRLLDPAKLLELRRQVLEICDRRGWLAGRSGFAHDAPEFVQLQVEVQALAEFEALRADSGLRLALAVTEPNRVSAVIGSRPVTFTRPGRKAH